MSDSTLDALLDHTARETAERHALGARLARYIVPPFDDVDCVQLFLLGVHDFREARQVLLRHTARALADPGTLELEDLRWLTAQCGSAEFRRHVQISKKLAPGLKAAGEAAFDETMRGRR